MVYVRIDAVNDAQRTSRSQMYCITDGTADEQGWWISPSRFEETVFYRNPHQKTGEWIPKTGWEAWCADGGKRVSKLEITDITDYGPEETLDITDFGDDGKGDDTPPLPPPPPPAARSTDRNRPPPPPPPPPAAKRQKIEPKSEDSYDSGKGGGYDDYKGGGSTGGYDSGGYDSDNAPGSNYDFGNKGGGKCKAPWAYGTQKQHGHKGFCSRMRLW